MISVRQVSKSFGPIKALQDVSFEIKQNEVIGFLGPNGAGKTTLMRLLMGIFPPTTGKIVLEGKGRIGYLAEHNPLYKDMTALEFLEFVSKLKGVTRSQRRREIEKVAAQCGIESVFKRLIGKLSKGYQQRIGLAQALLADPEILILDEPTNGLDPSQIIEVRKLIQTLGTKRTVILSTHILPEVQLTCGRVLILNNGRLAALLEMKQNETRLEEIFMKVVAGSVMTICPK